MAYWGMGRTLGEAIGKKTYGVDNPGSGKDAGLRRWVANTVGKFPGVIVSITPRRARGFPTCPSCHTAVRSCPLPECGADLRGTEEKGVDTRIATDMISLAWDANYDVAVLVSSDRDFVPVAEFLGKRGIIVIHGAFPPSASELSQACWGNLNIPDLRHAFQREQATPYSAP